MVSGFINTLKQLPNPAEATALLKEVNILAEHLTKLPQEKFKAVTGLLDDVIELQRQNPGTIEPLRMAVQLVMEINKVDAGTINEIQQLIKEAAKLPLKDLIKDIT